MAPFRLRFTGAAGSGKSLVARHFFARAASEGKRVLLTCYNRPLAESFLAALSLALGLAEVVEAYAGGVRMDTIFIDEGSGSLDPEALDLAVNTLVDLQSQGRVVGVVSHVPELKERIDVPLELTSTRGSRSAAFGLP